MPGEVADASVLGAFLFQEPRAEEAASLLERAELFEPELLAYELASIARKKALRHPELRPRIREALEVGLSLDIRWVRVDQPAVVELALDAGLTTYDASYLHVARTLGIPLVTFDDRLRAASER
ncbi:MAG: type II toxin-antitoxin system VapC family toxin [Planctomycetes bacterium]|nr:type II toxin-antitoxin system VapC family toxin [Planctomycetota bacterium]